MTIRPPEPDHRGWTSRTWIDWVISLGVMHSVRPGEVGVCALCWQPTPVGQDGSHFPRCYDCQHSHRTWLRMAVPISYSLPDQLTPLIWQAKNEPSRSWLRWPLASVLHAFLQSHWPCLEKMAGGPFDVATVVPSYPNKRGGMDHLKRLHGAVRPWRGNWDLNLLEKTAATVADDRRKQVVPGLFKAAPDRNVSGLRVLLIDDLFTSGGTLASAAAALMLAGAEKPLAVTIGRQLSPERDVSERLVQSLSERGLDLATCPVHRPS